MEKKVEFKVGEEILRGSLFIPEGNGPFPGVVFLHGRGSSRKNYLPMAKKLSENGIIGLAFDFRGCGESDGDFGNQTHRMGIEDGEAAVNFLLEQNIDRNRVGILGTSFGGYIAGMLLNKYDFICSVILRVPASYSDKTLDTTVTASQEKNFFGKKENWADSSSFTGLKNFKGDLLVIQSENDKLILPEAVRKYYEIAGSVKNRRYYIQKGAGHSFQDDSKGLAFFQKIVVDWFIETL